MGPEGHVEQVLTDYTLKGKSGSFPRDFIGEMLVGVARLRDE